MSDRPRQKISKFYFSVVCSLFWLILSFPTYAQSNNEDDPTVFPPDPLEFRTLDPMLPQSARDKKPLTEEEKTQLQQSLNELNQQATELFQAGDKVTAFAVWYRELRLTRVLGLLPEVEALTRIGAIVWQENSREDIKFITKRLQAIQTEATAKPIVELDLWRALATAYEQVRAPDKAVVAYEQILRAAREQKNTEEIAAALTKIGDLSLSWFDYQKAAVTYNELLNLAKEQNNSEQQITYLKQLAYIYAQLKQPLQIISTKQQLIELYQNLQNFTEIPELKLAIGSQLESLGQIEEAAQQYEETYSFAWSIQQYSGAADALRKLVALQLSLKRIDAALETSQVLLQTDQLGHNFYGMMNTYDQIAKLYLEQKNYSQALVAFERGLEIAKQLSYREPYFTRQIQEVNKQISRQS
ncbi:tetratricopeptide repeat protein [Phormidium sp. LEGE 05292]|uniref:tetratricopeptide repeat protein n=1 Tax=[Phormidium] sp. LEGE 05292 TaxID=767427 RepID=UPI00187F634E|nr:tetratricopeptide repeat protein [Phormidium sp. LEGE 05292]MBE9226036.1 tetratricopeptide repeat protein [Phormidium sp. LEGE 05292]